MNPSNIVGIDHYLEPSAVCNRIFKVDWRILMPKHGNIYLNHLHLLSTDQGRDVLAKLMKEYEAFQSRLKKMVPFLVPAIYIATLSPVRIEDITGSFPLVVDIDEKHRSHVLTSVLHNTSTQNRTADFLATHNRFAAVKEVPGSICRRDALLIKLEIDRVVFWIWLGISLLVAIGLGITAALLRHDVDSGIGVSCAVLGVVGILEAFLTWKLKNEG